MHLPLTITCLSKETLTKDVIEVIFTKPEHFSFNAGQFVLFDVPLIENPSDIQPRAYSIASAPEEKELRFVFQLTPGGRASRFVAEVLQPDMQMTMKGPFGIFTIKPSTKPLLFIGTGTGIAPFRAQLIDILSAQNDTRPLYLLIGAREESDLFWREELMHLAKKFPNLHIHITLSGEAKGWQGKRGRVQTILPSIVTDPTNINVYVCGAPQMVKDVKEFCITALGIPKSDVHAEGYI